MDVVITQQPFAVCKVHKVDNMRCWTAVCTGAFAETTVHYKLQNRNVKVVVLSGTSVHNYLAII